MTEETKKKLIDAGRSDLVEIHEFTQAGYAGVDRDGGIVDRRKFPDAMAMRKNSLLGIPEPKKI